jgi:hypothetical protein
MNLRRLDFEGELFFRRSPNRQLRTIGLWSNVMPRTSFTRGCRSSMQFSAGVSKGAGAGAAPAYLSEGSGGLEKVSIDAQFPYF